MLAVCLGKQNNRVPATCRHERISVYEAIPLAASRQSGQRSRRDFKVKQMYHSSRPPVCHGRAFLRSLGAGLTVTRALALHKMLFVMNASHRHSCMDSEHTSKLSAASSPPVANNQEADPRTSGCEQNTKFPHHNQTIIRFGRMH